MSDNQKPFGISIGFDEYQLKCAETAIYPNRHNLYGLMYCALGLNGEAGEVAEKVKKIFRDEGRNFDLQGMVPKRIEIAKELGDALWYLSECATQIGMTLSQIAEINLAKLSVRKQTGMLSGSGDNR